MDNELFEDERAENDNLVNETPKATGKREIEYHAPVREFDNKKHLVTNIGFTAKAAEKYQIIWLVPETDEECEERYDCKLIELISAGVRQLSTRPDYKTVGFYAAGDIDSNGVKIAKDSVFIGTLKPEGHEAMQSLADGYQVGKRVVGTGQKVMAQKAVAAEKELGMSMEEMVAKMKAMKADGLLTD